MAIVVVQAKSTLKWYFLASKPIFKKFLGYFYPPTLPMQNNRVKMVPKQVFTGGGFKSPPATRCPFQRPLLVNRQKT